MTEPLRRRKYEASIEACRPLAPVHAAVAAPRVPIILTSRADKTFARAWQAIPSPFSLPMRTASLLPESASFPGEA